MYQCAAFIEKRHALFIIHLGKQQIFLSAENMYQTQETYLSLRHFSFYIATLQRHASLCST